MLVITKRLGSDNFKLIHKITDKKFFSNLALLVDGDAEEATVVAAKVCFLLFCSFLIKFLESCFERTIQKRFKEKGPLADFGPSMTLIIKYLQSNILIETNIW